MKGSKGTTQNKCKYCGTLHEPQRYPVNGKTCEGCGRANHFEWVCRSASRRVMRHTVRKKHREVHNLHQEVKEIEVSTYEFDVVR